MQPTPPLLFEIVTLCSPISLHLLVVTPYARHRRRSVCSTSPSIRLLLCISFSKTLGKFSFSIYLFFSRSFLFSFNFMNTMSKELSADMSKKHTGTMSTYCPAPLRSTPPLRVTAMRNRYLCNWAVYLTKNLICGPVLLLQSFIVLGYIFLKGFRFIVKIDCESMANCIVNLCRMFCDATWQPILRNDSRIIFLCNICFCINTLDVH
ncbi:unnamed protein product [Malus baccata var. baccata]